MTSESSFYLKAIRFVPFFFHITITYNFTRPELNNKKEAKAVDICKTWHCCVNFRHTSNRDINLPMERPKVGLLSPTLFEEKCKLNLQWLHLNDGFFSPLFHQKLVKDMSHGFLLLLHSYLVGISSPYCDFISLCFIFSSWSRGAARHWRSLPCGTEWGSPAS